MMQCVLLAMYEVYQVHSSRMSVTVDSIAPTVLLPKELPVASKHLHHGCQYTNDDISQQAWPHVLP